MYSVCGVYVCIDNVPTRQCLIISASYKDMPNLLTTLQWMEELLSVPALTGKDWFNNSFMHFYHCIIIHSTIKVWDVITGKCNHTLTGHTDEVEVRIGYNRIMFVVHC